MANTSEFAKHRKFSDSPKQLIISPSQEHRYSLIILHGRGSSAQKFFPNLLDTKNPRTHETEVTRTLFLATKFVFPTASKRRAAAYSRNVSIEVYESMV